MTEFVTEFRFVTESVTDDLEIRDRFFLMVLVYAAQLNTISLVPAVVTRIYLCFLGYILVFGQLFSGLFLFP